MLPARANPSSEVPAPPPPPPPYMSDGANTRGALAMMAMRSASTSASSMKCVVSNTEREVRAAMISSQIARRDSGSMPAVGSSRSTNCGLPISAMATESFLFWPPERIEAAEVSFSKSPTRRIQLSTSRRRLASATPLMAPRSFKCS